MTKKKPTGFVASCACGAVVGAMDAERTDRAEAGQLLGGWLAAGYTITPRFAGSWQVTIEPCRCEDEAAEQDHPQLRPYGQLLKDLLVVLECESALELSTDKAWDVLERHGWSSEDRLHLPASEFVSRMRRGALERLKSAIQPNGEPA